MLAMSTESERDNQAVVIGHVNPCGSINFIDWDIKEGQAIHLSRTIMNGFNRNFAISQLCKLMVACHW